VCVYVPGWVGGWVCESIYVCVCLCVRVCVYVRRGCEGEVSGASCTPLSLVSNSLLLRTDNEMGCIPNGICLGRC